MSLAIAPAGTAGSTAVTLEEAKAALKKKNTTDVEDVLILSYVRAAEAAIAHRTGPLVPTLVSERHDGGGTTIVLKQPRAISLTSVVYADGRATPALSSYDLDPDTGILYWEAGTVGRFYGGPRNVKVSYTAGFSTLPDDLRKGVLELVRHLWETQRGAGAANRPQFPGDDVDVTPIVGAFTSWPIRVQQLVDPFTTPKVGG